MKNVRVKVRFHTCIKQYDFAIFENNTCLLVVVGQDDWWHTKAAAIRNAKAMAKRIGIPYSDKIIKQHGC